MISDAEFSWSAKSQVKRAQESRNTKDLAYAYRVQNVVFLENLSVRNVTVGDAHVQGVLDWAVVPHQVPHITLIESSIDGGQVENVSACGK